MARSSALPAVDVAQRLRASNRRIAWTLASIAAVFFAGIIATRWLGGGTIGIGVMGAVVLLFLVVAIGRNLRGGGAPAGESPSPTEVSARGTEGRDAHERDSSARAGGVRR